MIKIHPITPLDLERLSVLSKSTFVSSHGKSASKKDIDIYIHYTYSVKLLRKELNDINNFFYFLICAILNNFSFFNASIFGGESHIYFIASQTTCNP